MKERPILFKTEMVRAILDGSKTQTRRLNGFDKINKNPNDYEFLGYIKGANNYFAARFRSAGIENQVYVKSPYGDAGNQLWVKETWRTWHSLDHVKPSNLENGVIVDYAAGGNSVGAGIVCDVSKKWRSPLFMQKRFSRIQLEITGIRVERLDEISKADAIAEGAKFINFGKDKWGNQLDGWRADKIPERAEECLSSAKWAYVHLWESINGKGSWATNPYVWVIEFKRLNA